MVALILPVMLVGSVWGIRSELLAGHSTAWWFAVGLAGFLGWGVGQF